jgi:polysaccharide export outer membrane protein
MHFPEGWTATNNRSRAAGTFGMVSVALLLVSGTGCANKHEDLMQFLKENEHSVTAAEYRVGVPDVLGINAPRAVEIDNTVQSVGPDGKLNLRLLGPVSVVGLTPKEIEVKLEQLLGPYYEDPVVHVEVVSFLSKKYYVFGEVSAEGPQPYTGKDSVIDALAKARPEFTAWRSIVQVMRPSANPGEINQITVDFDKMMRQGDMRLNVLLEPGDVVYVPPTVLGWLGNRVQEVLYPFLPAFQAYSTPASFIATTDVYNDRD